MIHIESFVMAVLLIFAGIGLITCLFGISVAVCWLCEKIKRMQNGR